LDEISGVSLFTYLYVIGIDI